MAIFLKKTSFFLIITTFIISLTSLAYAEYVNVQGRIYSSEPFEEKGSIRRFLVYDEDDKEAPEYRKVFDEYILDLEELQEYGEIPENRKKDEDLAKMNYNGPIQLK